MAFKWLKTRQSKYTGYVTLYLVVTIGVLAAANWLANRHNKSVDLTANKRYSLSDQTEKVVKNLKSDAKIVYFDQTSRFQQAKDLLDRYDNLSPKLEVTYIDPDKQPTAAKSAGVRNYGTIFVDTGARQEEAKSLTEEEITGALIRSLKGGERTVCFVSGSGEHSLEESGRTGYSSAKEALERDNYKTRAVSLMGADRQATPAPTTVRPDQTTVEPAAAPGIPEDCTILVVAGPRYEYSEPAVSSIKTYVENGGRALIMLDPPMTLGQQETRPNPALEKQLDSWGIALNRDLVVDTSGIGQLFGLSEVVPLVTNYESHAIVREMREVATAFPLARSLEVKGGAEKLFSTTGNSYATTNLGRAEIRIDPARDRKGPLPIGAAATIDGKGRVVVVGSSSWASNNIFRFNGNRDLFLNTMNWLSSDEELISIRPKDPEDRRLTLNRRQMSLLFWSSVVFLPLIVIGSGLAVWWRRR
jgi:ABC-type uncharacterized transport system involved in gliding motility auxiliary subunit